jgi:hypothetical protein
MSVRQRDVVCGRTVPGERPYRGSSPTGCTIGVVTGCIFFVVFGLSLGNSFNFVWEESAAQLFSWPWPLLPPGRSRGNRRDHTLVDCSARPGARTLETGHCNLFALAHFQLISSGGCTSALAPIASIGVVRRRIATCQLRLLHAQVQVSSHKESRTETQTDQPFRRPAVLSANHM